MCLRHLKKFIVYFPDHKEQRKTDLSQTFLYIPHPSPLLFLLPICFNLHLKGNYSSYAYIRLSIAPPPPPFRLTPQATYGAVRYSTLSLPLTLTHTRPHAGDASRRKLLPISGSLGCCLKTHQVIRLFPERTCRRRGLSAVLASVSVPWAVRQTQL